MFGKNIGQKLRNNEIRLTDQRVAILEVMAGNRGKHLSAEEVLVQAREKHPNIGIATVYRALDKFAAVDILYKTIFNDDKYRYEIKDGDDEHHHHHVICLTCGKIVELEDDLLCSLEKQLETEGFEVVDHELKFFVYCPACRKGKSVQRNKSPLNKC